MKTYVYDIETFKELSLFCFRDFYTDELILFEISKNKNELKDLNNFIKNQNLRIVTLNGIHFDSVVTNYLLSNYNKFINLSPFEICNKIYKCSQEIILSNDEQHEFSKYKYQKLYEEIDLFLLVSKGIRISKKLSLKFYAYNMDMDIMEMPVDHGKENLTDEDIKKVITYVKQDVNVTKELALKKREEINLRFWIRKEYGLDCLSWDAPKIASELLLDSYCKKTLPENSNLYDYKKEVRNRRYEKPSKIKLGDFIPKIEFKTKQFQELYNRICNSYNTFSEEIIVRNPDNTFIKIQYGNGGLHNIQEILKFESKKDKTYIDFDAKSLYPNLIKNLKAINRELGTSMLDVYNEILEERYIAKKNGDKIKDTFFKLIANSASGLLDNQYSWLYSPEQILGLRITGQLFLTRYVEECLLHNIKVISVNTDGCLVESNNQYDELLKVVKLIEEEFNLELEETIYKFINFKSVNDYIGYTTNGKIKVKGEFLYEKQLEGSNEFLIIPIALKEYYVNNIPVSTTIKNHSNIFDFCMGKKISRDYKVFYRGQQVQQLNRIFVSKKGAYLYKQKKNKSTMENVLKDTPVCIYNTPDGKSPQELQVDFNYYIKKANEKIIEMNNNNQMSLFA